MKLAKYDNIYFIGIGGIGMSALARYFKGKHKRVGGYDKTPSDITKALEKEGISVHFIDGVSQIDRDFKDIETTLVVYTPAIPGDHEELTYFRQNDFDVFKRARILAEIANQGKSIAVAGTHGKTTTSSLITHIFNQNKAVASAFLGGIAKNAGSNFISGSGKTVILEADEFDRSFHQLEPDVALITAMDADHLDVYGTAQALQQAFADFAKRVKPSGTLILRHGLPLHGITYGLTEEADYHASEIFIEKGTYHFTLHTPKGDKRQLTSGLPGRHNVENAVGAAAACLEYGLSMDKVAKGIAGFRGVTRRFDVHVHNERYIYIDDYAHHPEEIRALLSSVREMFPNKKITAIFQPHLFSRTKDFALAFAEVLSLPDALIMMDIYPAREKPIPGITSKWLMTKIDLADKKLMTADEIKEYIALDPPELLVTLGAGDIDRLVQPLKEILLA
jgi:UDP-N-acetylmuramate--alanine ligase